MKNPKALERATSRNIRPRLIGMGGAGLFGLVALVTVLAPMASAAPIMFRAPFVAATPVATTSLAQHGLNAQILVPLPATFVLATGSAQASAIAVVTASNSPPAIASMAATVGLRGLAFTAPATGSVVVNVVWTVTYQAALHVQPGRLLGPVPAMQAQVVLRVGTSVLDQATGVMLPGGFGSVTLVDKVLHSGDYASQVSHLTVLVATQPLDVQAGGTYLISTNINVLVAALQLASAPGGLATASLSLTPSTHLSLITVA